MIDLYTWPTPNGHKIHIMLEEVGLNYKVIPVNIWKGDQFKEDFLKISPNNKMPAMVDHEGPHEKPYAVFESGAILIYLAEKTGKFMPKDLSRRCIVLQWLMFQMGSIGPMFGQAHHFRHYAPDKIDYAFNRYTNEAGRLYKVLDQRLAGVKYLAGKDYTIADIACYPWVRDPQRKGQKQSDFPNVSRWLEEISSREAVISGMKVLSEFRRDFSKEIDPETRENLFGATQYGLS